MKEKLKKPGYEAPRLETTSFKPEQGYATSGVTQRFNDVAINFQS